MVKTEQFLERLAYYEITRDIAKQAGLLKRDYSKQGHTLTLADTLIAAVCIENDLVLITDNRKHFPMPELRQYPLPVHKRVA